MPTLLLERLFDFTCDLASAARLFTFAQIARHPDVSWRAQPQKAVSSMLRPYRDSFERVTHPVGGNHIWRLSRLERKRRGIHERKVDGRSQKAEHWLGLGDIWLALTFAGGRPDEWKTEPSHQFDVMCKWQNHLYLIEYQRTVITMKQWLSKWEKRRNWYKEQKWSVKPIVVLVTEHYQEPDTMCVPKGTIHAKSIEELPRILNKTRA